jgi:hypothetical protein
MKNIKNSVIGAMLCVAGSLFNTNSYAAPPAPSVNGIVTSAGPPVKTSKNVAVPMVQSSGSIAIKLTPVYLSNIKSPNWTAAANALMVDTIAGTLAASTVEALPTQYAIVNQTNHLIGWSNLVLSTTAPMWAGMLNPSAPFNNELGGPSVWVVIDAQSMTGQNSVSLDSLQVTSVTSPDGNYLGVTTNFIGLSYSPRAIVIQADGTVITSGPASQKGKRVIVFSQNKVFSADTQSALNNVQSWVNFYSPYYLTYTVQVIGDNTTLSSTTVSTAPIVFPSPKNLDVAIVNNGDGTVSVSVPNASTNWFYQIWGSTSLGLPMPSWVFSGIVKGTNSIPITITPAGSMFYRSSPQ